MHKGAAHPDAVLFSPLAGIAPWKLISSVTNKTSAYVSCLISHGVPTRSSHPEIHAVGESFPKSRVHLLFLAHVQRNLPFVLGRALYSVHISLKMNSCAVCKQPSEKKCSLCGNVFYCSREHQKADWKTHKSKCVSFKVRITFLVKLLFFYCV